ncbi:MAG: beta-galactosidase [Actinomycetota bacterium]
MPGVRMLTAVALAGAALAAPALAAGAPDRPMGRVFDWGHELNQEELARWNPRSAPPIPARAWYRTIDGILRDAGGSGLWFSGYAALPFDIPVHPKEPSRWRNPGVYSREFRATGLSWDLNVEARAAKIALKRKWAVVANPATEAPTRRLSLLDPGYERAALAEIRRLVPRYAALPYVHAYTGSDEPIAILPRGRAAASPFGRRLRREVRARYGWAPPSPAARPTRSATEGLRWLAFSRYTSDRFFAMKERQARLVKRLDPDAVVSPNDYGFIDGFMPWDYTRLARFADIVEADPYVSYAERVTPGRGRYNPGFGAKLLSDLTGRPVRIVIQAFPYAGYTPVPADLDAWTAQALRAGATHVSFYALGNPRFTNRRLYDRMLDIARRLRGTRLPAPPVDPATVVVYATASEGQGQPRRRGDARYRTSGDALYTTYALLGELANGAFTFDSDTRLLAEPQRLDRARLLWLPRADTLDRAFAERVLAWVRDGGTLVLTDPDGFTRAPDGSSLTGIRSELVGAPLGGPRPGRMLLVNGDALAAGLPDDVLAVPLEGEVRRGFAAVPEGATVVARFLDDAPAALSRRVGRGRVVAFASDPMRPEALDRPYDLVTLVAALQRAGGGSLGDAAWTYRLPGTRADGRAPWQGSYDP